MSKNDFSDIGEIFLKDVIAFTASSIVEKLQRKGPQVQKEIWEIYREFPAQLADWLGPEGHEEAVVPDTERRYLPLSKTYLLRKRTMFKKRRKSLGGRQAFYSYSGKLYRELESFGFSFGDISKYVKVQASLDGSHWFNVYQKNYPSLKFRLKKRLKKTENITSELRYRVITDRKILENLIEKKISTFNFKKLQYNDVWRPFLTPAIRYFDKKFVSGKLEEILEGPMLWV